jgi:MarR family
MTTKEKIWDGRGDRLVDARYSQFPGQAADDLRLNGLHFRLLAHIGRQNQKRGWLRLSQTELSDAWDCSRSRISTAVNELVVMGYVVKKSQSESGESFCLYKVVDGDDVPPIPQMVPRGECSAVGTLPGKEGVFRIEDTSQKGECSAEGTPVFRPGNTSVPIMDTIKKPTTPAIAEHTPTAPSASGTKRVRVNGDSPVEKLRASGEDLHVVDGLIAPLWGALRFPKGEDPEPWLRSIGAALGDISPAVIERTATLIRTSRTVWPSAAQALKLAERAALDLPLTHYPTGSIPFRAWCEHYRATGRAFWAKACEERGYVAERGPVPPQRKRSAA